MAFTITRMDRDRPIEVFGSAAPDWSSLPATLNNIDGRNPTAPFPALRGPATAYLGAIGETLAGRHLGDHEAGPEPRREAPERRIGDARYRREYNRVRQRDAPDRQSLSRVCKRADHYLHII